MDVRKLRAKMVEKSVSVDHLAKSIGINRASLYRKLNNAEKITIGEARRISDALELTCDEATLIFLQ